MAYHWPADTVFHELTLEVDDRTCWQCQHLRTVCCHRERRFFTCAGPVQLVCKLCHCSNQACSEKGHETLYVVRELTQKRVWFAETLLSSSAAEVQRRLGGGLFQTLVGSQ
jgi:hypothetical protein